MVAMRVVGQNLIRRLYYAIRRILTLSRLERLWGAHRRNIVGYNFVFRSRLASSWHGMGNAKSLTKHISEVCYMQTIYINGVRATITDLATLFERVRKGLDCILAIHMTKAQNIAIVTA